MRRPTLNLLVDTAAFTAFVLLTTTGVLVRYVLPPGSGRFSTLWGMDRHDWGQIHFWIAVFLMAALGLHLLLHWRWIVCVVKGRPREGSGVRAGLAIVGLLALAGLAAAPFFGRVEQIGEPSHRRHSPDSPAIDPYQIDGSTTLREIEERTGVPAVEILRGLGLPLDLPADERLGRLRKSYSFEMYSVREVIRKHLAER